MDFVAQSILALSGARVSALFLLAFCSLAQLTVAQEKTAMNPVADHHLHIRSASAAILLKEIRTAIDPDDRVEDLAAIEHRELIAALDNAGIERGLVLSNAYMFGMPDINPEKELPYVQAENNFLAQQVGLAGGRLLGLCSVNPLAAYAVAETRRCNEELGLAGLKLHLANSDVDLLNDAHIASLQTLFRYLNDIGFPVLAHIRTRNPEYGSADVAAFINDVLSQAPDIEVQIAHMAGWGGFDTPTESALGEFLAAFKDGRLNPGKIQFDLAAVVAEPDLYEYGKHAERIRENNKRLSSVIAAMPAHQVLFASDWSAWPPHPERRNKIREYAESLPRLLDLMPERLQQTYEARGFILTKNRG